MRSEGKCLILGLAFGYKWISIAAFVRSLRCCGYDGDLTLFVGGTNSVTRSELKRYNVESIPIDLRFPYHESLGECAILNRKHLNEAAPHIQRYAMYCMYLKRWSGRYERVMLTDVKDVWFQLNPFAFDAGTAEVCFFEEDAARAIKDCALNALWIRSAFGEEALNRIKDNRIICSGTTIGNSEAVFAYCGAMLECMAQHAVVGFGGDQGVHNYLIHTGMIKGTKVFPNEDGPVLTLATRSATASFDDHGNLLNTAQKVPNVVHQYDRFPEITKIVNRRFLTVGQRAWISLALAKAKLRSHVS